MSTGRRPIDATHLVAANGLLDRRLFLGSAALGGIGALAAPAGAAAEEAPRLLMPRWMHEEGAPLSGYGHPSPHEAHIARHIRPTREVSPGAGSSRTPIERLDGVITPNGLHFERHHSGIPEIDPALHRLKVHGRVARALSFGVDDLLGYPMTSRLVFLECSGNSWMNTGAEPPQFSAGVLHGLVSASEWAGVPLGLLLDEAGVSGDADWILAEGADAASMSRSIPLRKAREDVLLALYQNGERLRPEQGYPMRLVVPGWEGNLQVKWVHRIEVTKGPVETRDETAKYTDALPDGRARQFSFTMGVKSVITRPSLGYRMTGPGFYEITGLAWSGRGRIRKVEVSADGGRSWAEAALAEPVLAQCLTRFRIPWTWDGGPAVLQSRATDEEGRVQPRRDDVISRFAPRFVYHFNAIQSWAIAPSGEIRNVFV